MAVETFQFIDRYVESLKEEGWIESEAVEKAFRRVQRHQLIEQVYRGKLEQPDLIQIDFANPEHLEMIYSNSALMTHWPEPSSSSQPGLVAMMLELLELRPGMRVLEIGAGTGYNAALMAELVSDPSLITTIDIQQDVVEQTRRRLAAAGYDAIHVLAQDGVYGYQDHAPYDRIVATVGCSDLSPHWLVQLAPEGFMLIPLIHGSSGSCPLTRAEKNARILGQIRGYSSFMSVLGESFLDLWSSIGADIQFARSLADTEPDVERPVFQGLQEYPEPTPRLDKEWAGRLEFLYFLALHTQRTFTCWKGVGLGHQKDFVLLGSDSIRLYGAQAPSIYQELERIYRRWEGLGKPRMLDYEIEFLPLSEADRHKPVSEPNTWVIDRKFHRQIVRLPV